MSKLKKLIMMANVSSDVSSDVSQSNKYLTIEALEDGLTVSFSNPSQYSLNGTDWNKISAYTKTPAISSGGKIYFKAEGLTPNDRNGIGKFTVSKRFNLSGNVMSMLFGDEAEGKTDLTGYNYAFCNMFKSRTELVSVSKNFLPATTLTIYCYRYMFDGCTSLVTAPELPATNLADSCYNYMFYNCTSLVTAPELPATELTSYCYNAMFDGCTSLTTVELPATTLANYCYGSMFQNCTSLNYIKMLAIDISAKGCLSYWVNNVSPTGTFVKSNDATWNVTGMSGIPKNWTVETV